MRKEIEFQHLKTNDEKEILVKDFCKRDIKNEK